MWTYSNAWDTILELLRSKSQEIGIAADAIQPGKYRETPKSAPFVWLYMEPGDFIGLSQSHSGDGIATLMIFIGLKPETSSQAANIKGHNAAVRIVKALVDSGHPFLWPTSPVSMDEVSTLYTATRIECGVPYSLESE